MHGKNGVGTVEDQRWRTLTTGIAKILFHIAPLPSSTVHLQLVP